MAGLSAGAALGAGWVLAGLVLADAPARPLRLFASAVMGDGALGPGPLSLTVVVVGAVVLLFMGALWGLLYGPLLWALPDLSEDRVWHTYFGAAFGVGAHIVNTLLIAQPGATWSLEPGTLLPELGLHLVFFGLPLSAVFALRSSPARRRRRAAARS